MKFEPLSRRRPRGVDWAGNVEMRCAHRSSTRAGPFDAVIDVVRSRRLMRGARLLLLPAPGFLCALLRCLRCLPSLLRHAALLSCVSGDVVQCPRGSRTPYSDYYSAIKKPVFLRDVARPDAHPR